MILLNFVIGDENMRKMAVIYNPVATGMQRLSLEKIKKIFNKRWKTDLLESKKSGDTPKLVKKANDDYDWIVTMGGDGTMGEAIRALNKVSQHGVYSHIPVGTTNDIANNLGMRGYDPYTLIEKMTDSSGFKMINMDALEVNDRAVGYISACGAFTDITYRTPRTLKKYFGTLGYYAMAGMMVPEIVQDLTKKPLKLRYFRNNKIYETEALTLLVSNSRNFAGLNLYPKASISDGKFEVAILRKVPFLRLLDFGLEVTNYNDGNFKIEDYADYIDYFQTDKFEVMIDTDKTSLNNDGDEYKTDLKNVRYDIKKKIKVMVPKTK